MHFRPPWTLSLILIPLAAGFAWLGTWQLNRMHEKQQLIDSFELAPELEWPLALTDTRPYSRVRVRGEYERSWHVLLDNKVLGGRAGVHVLSLFYPTQGKPVLVNRGWLPMAPDRSSLPGVPTPSGLVTISGMLGVPDQSGLRLGQPQALGNLAGSVLVTYLDLDAINAATGGILSSRMVLLAADDPSGFDGRDWRPTVILPSQHGAYAVQWFALALATSIIWISLSWKRWKRP